MKNEESLFCDDCERKIRLDYEVVLPGKEIGDHLPAEEEPYIQEKTKFTETEEDGTLLQESEGENDSEEDDTFKPDESEVNDSIEDKTSIPEDDDITRRPVEVPHFQEVTEGNVSADDEPSVQEEKEWTAPATGEPVGPALTPKKKKSGRTIIWIALLLLLPVAFLIYNGTVRKSNLERSGWEEAVSKNSVEGYLTYIEEHPGGAHAEEAEAALIRLKTDEASVWEQMRTTDKVTELRDFLQQHPASNYTPLVKRRLDSLSWMGALHSNTAASYSDYMMMVQSGEFKGDYFAEAEERHGMLFQSYPVDVATLDSIRTIVNGFYSALSAVDHSGMSRWLAPKVHRFFNSGTATRERILGELLVAGSQTQGATLKFIPDLQSVQYNKTFNDHYKVNVPLLKTYQKEGTVEQVSGYIVHMELDPLLQIISIYETKPFSGAP